MNIINNQPVVQKLSQSLSQNETSNIAMAVETPTILTDWWLVDPDHSVPLDGWKNVDRYIGPDSQVRYNFIASVPMGGIADLNTVVQYDDEVGYTEEFKTTGMVYPNTVGPIPGSCFTVQGSQKCAIYMVTDINVITMRSNPFIEVTFVLLSRDPSKVKQLNRQVLKRYTTCLESIGTTKSLVIQEDALEILQDHVKNYLDLVFLYRDLFYDEQAGAFLFDGLPDRDGHRAKFIDMTLWRLMFDEGIVIFDDVVSYVNSNNLKKIEPIFTACPDVLVDDHTYRRSILYRIVMNENRKKDRFDEYRYPYIWNPTERITKYQGQDIWYLEGYDKHPGNEFTDFYIWDEEFLCKIRNNELYEVSDENGDTLGCSPDACHKCSHHCTGSPVMCYNPYLRNAIINWVNGEEIDFLNGISIVDARTIENYYLIPVLMGIYKQYIHQLQDSGTTL